MHNELTKKDIEMMQAELDHRENELMPQQLEAVKVARAFGDLSENFEYKAAKQELNRNKGRIRYLKNMIATARIIPESGPGGGAGLYDKITVYIPEDDAEETYQIVTTIRQDTLRGLISKESPVGRALLGKKAGDTVRVELDNGGGYDMVIRSVEPCGDDGSAPLNSY